MPEVEIKAIDEKLMGFAEWQGKKVSFRYTEPGDRVEFEPRGKRKRRYNKILSIQRANTWQVTCSHFSACGGCAGQHIDYKQQFQLKTEPVLQHFNQLTGFPLSAIQPEDIFHYRNRMDFTVLPGPIIGLREAGNFRKTVNISKCYIQSELANDEMERIRLVLQDFNDICRDRREHTGFLKYITLRKGIFSNELMVICTFSQEGEGNERILEFSQQILDNCQAQHILFCYNRRLSEVSAQGKINILRGCDCYRENLLGKEFLVPFDSFFQPNPRAFLAIIQFIQEKIAEVDARELFDFFCGNGFFSILFGNNFNTLRGIDITPSSIDRANEQLQRLYPQKNIDFTILDLYSLKNKDFLEQIHNETIVIVDPPRNGIGEKFLQKLCQSQANYLIYVSCNPAMQMAELAELQPYFTIMDGLITDPYPHTPHLESVVFLQRKQIS